MALKACIVIQIILMTVIVLTAFFTMSSCTYTVNCVHTQGSASDVIDEEQDATPEVSPTLNLKGI